MNKKKMGILLFAIALGLAAATSANAGLIMSHSTPNDVPELSRVEALHSAPNDLSDLPHTEYFTNLTLTPNEKITGTAMAFTNTPDWTKENNDRMSVNQGISNNAAVRSILMSNRLDSLGGKSQKFNTVVDFGKLGLWDVLNAYAETKPDTDQADLEFKITPDYNDLSYDLKPAIDTETRIQIYHHSS
jgi:hypothetical protein